MVAVTILVLIYSDGDGAAVVNIDDVHTITIS